MFDLRLPIIVCCLFLLACNGTSEEKKFRSSAIVPSPISMETGDGKSTYVVGDSISFFIDADETIGDSGEPLVYMDDSLLGKFPTFPVTLHLGTTGQGVGGHTLRVSLQSNGKLEGKTMGFTLLSDIVPVAYSYEIIQTYPHDHKSYTQGLLIHQGVMYEGLGQTGASALRKIDWNTGKVIREAALDKNVFGEGIAWHMDRIYQLSWTSNVGFIFDPETLEEAGRFYFKGEGWGLTSDSTYLVKSNGTHRITFHRPGDFAEAKSIEVFTDKGAVTHLNELEYIQGKIYANVWRTSDLVIIDPGTGKVEGIVDLSGILPKSGLPDNVDVLNGIAFDAKSDRLFVTGKYWPKLFEIRLVAKKSPA